MKIEISADVAEKGLKGGINVELGEIGNGLIAKAKEFMANPEAALGRLGQMVVNGALYGGGGSKKENSDGDGSSSGFSEI